MVIRMAFEMVPLTLQLIPVLEFVYAMSLAAEFRVSVSCVAISQNHSAYWCSKSRTIFGVDRIVLLS